MRLCRGGRCIESIGVASTGFGGREPEVIAPREIAREILGEASMTLSERVLADGSRALLPRTIETIDLYLVTEEGVRGPVHVRVLVVQRGPLLLNDAVLSALRIVIIDPLNGIWCFREEIGSRERRGV